MGYSDTLCRIHDTCVSVFIGFLNWPSRREGAEDADDGSHRVARMRDVPLYKSRI